MSKIALSGNINGTGTFIITSPMSNSNYSLELPTVTGTLVATDSTNNLSVRSVNGGQLAGMRNKIINGKMEIAQRGTTFTSPATTSYTLDRWRVDYVTAAAVTVSQQTDVPSSNEFQDSLRIAVTTADTSIASGDVFTLTQIVEGFNVRDLIGRTFTLSFWVRSSKTGTHCVSFRNSAADRSYIAEYFVFAANTWEYKTVTVTGGLITAGTWNWENGIGLYVSWALMSGTNFHAAAGAWQTANDVATSSQVNCLDTIGNIFAITGVQLEVGTLPTAFEHRFYGLELSLCQRYYETGAYSVSGYAPASGQTADHIYFKVQKREIPFTITADTSIQAANTSSVVTDNKSVTGVRAVGIVTATGSAFAQGIYTASSEL